LLWLETIGLITDKKSGKKFLTNPKISFTFVKSLKLTGDERYSVFKFKKSSLKNFLVRKRFLSL
jgi:hypothetical protein